MTTKSKKYKMNRKTADRLKDELVARIQKWNADPEHSYIIDRAVIFGSYVNEPDWMELSDLDVATHLKNRYSGEMQKQTTKTEYTRLIGEFPSYTQYEPYLACYRATIVAMRAGSHYISMHNLGGDDEAIFSKKYIELDVGQINRKV